MNEIHKKDTKRFDKILLNQWFRETVFIGGLINKLYRLKSLKS